jgi:hypothetical protein
MAADLHVFRQFGTRISQPFGQRGHLKTFTTWRHSLIAAEPAMREPSEATFATTIDLAAKPWQRWLNKGLNADQD